MTEAAFVRANIKRWEEFEAKLKDLKHQDPDLLAGWYVQLTDDLAYARTQFPGGEITLYLNQLVASLHSRIYSNRREKKQRLLNFWRYEVPAVYYRHRMALLYSALVFFVAALIGALSAAHDFNFVRLILGDSYVNMTEANIAKDDPMAVYKSMRQSDMFFAITLNNIKVSFMAFLAGIFTAIGSGLLLFYNGVMLGSFQYFFYQKGLLITSVLSIWIHGTLEIPAIVLAGAAGMVMGNGLVFPGTYHRLESLARSAREGLKMVVGLVPVFIVAGFLESFVTRHTQLPLLIKLLIIGLSATFIIYYFVIYPAKLYSKHGKYQQN